jgi:organic radical activating enzyme
LKFLKIKKLKTLDSKAIQEFKNNSNKIFFYGLCKFTEYSTAGANFINLKIDGIFDSNINTPRLDKNLFPIKIQDELSEISLDSVFIITCSHFFSVERYLNLKGFYNIYDSCELVNLHLENSNLSGVEKIMVSRAFKSLSEKKNHITKQFTNLTIPSLDLILTEKCTLNCADCANLMPYFKSPKDSDLDIMLSSLNKLTENIDKLTELRILGGEPFIFKKIDLVINQALLSNKIEQLIIYTNGTILPKEHILECLQNPRVMLEITNYGKLSRNFQRLLDACESRGIYFTVRELGESWDDSANIDRPSRSAQEDQFIFEECCAKYLYTLMHGKLYRCPFSASLDAIKSVNLKSDNSLTIHGNIEFTRSELQKFVYKTSFFDSCKFCQGRSKVLSRVQPARQANFTREPFQRFPIIQIA